MASSKQVTDRTHSAFRSNYGTQVRSASSSVVRRSHCSLGVSLTCPFDSVREQHTAIFHVTDPVTLPLSLQSLKSTSLGRKSECVLLRLQ